MNRRFLPGADKSEKPGINRHHQLVISEKSKAALKSEKKVRDSLPGDWMYNENKANEVWNELENIASSNERGMMQKEKNPFKKIDESATKIRNTITNFEVQDQEFLMEFMDLLGDDSFVDSIDQESILLEAQIRLQQMIDEHVDFGERQASLLHSLTSWFNDVQNNPETRDGSRHQDVSSYNVDRLRDLIENYMVHTSSNLEKAEILHQDLVQNLSSKVNEYQKTISQKDLQLNQMNQTLSMSNSRGRNRSRASLRDIVNYDSELAVSQRKVLELQQQLSTLKHALVEYSQVNQSDAIKQLMKQAESIDPNGNQASLTMSAFMKELPGDGSGSMLHPSSSPLSHDSSAISVEKEIEFESKLRVLAAQIQNLKDDNKTLRDQIISNKQNEIVADKKLSTMERQKKTIENALQSANKKLELMKSTYESTIQELKQNQEAIISSERSGESIIDVRREYEEKIDRLSEEYRKNLADYQAKSDANYQKKVREIAKACDQGEMAKALDELTLQYQQQFLEMQRQHKKQMNDEKRRAAEKINQISKHYENILQKKEDTIEIIQKSVDNEVKNRLLDVQIEYDEKFNLKNLENHENSLNELNQIRREMKASIDQLKEKLIKVTRERDTLRTLIETNDLAADLMDELNGNNNEEEEEANEDDVLQQSLQSLKEKEIENKVAEKFTLMLQAQKEILTEAHKWELENAKNYFKMKYDNEYDNFRGKVAFSCTELKDQLMDDKNVIESPALIDNLLETTLKLVDYDSDEHLNNIFQNPTIPLTDVDVKIDELKKKIISLTSENELWKKTFDHIQKNQIENGTKVNKEDIAQTMKSLLAGQASDMAEIERENQILRDKLNRLSSSKLNLIAETQPPLPEIKEVDLKISRSVYFCIATNNVKEEIPPSTISKTIPQSTSIELKKDIVVFHESPRSTDTLNKSGRSVSFAQNNVNKNSSRNSGRNSTRSNDSTASNGQIGCFHCHFLYNPTNITKQIVECNVAHCPKCTHLTLLPQSEEIDDLTISDEENEYDKDNIDGNTDNSGNVSFRSQESKNSVENEDNSKMNIESQQQVSMTPDRVAQMTSPVITRPLTPKDEENKEKTDSNISNNMDVSLPTKPPTGLNEAVDIEKMEREKNAQAKEDEKRKAEEAEKIRANEIKEKLDKSVIRNQKLKAKMKLFEKQFSDVEQQYIKKINKMTEDMSKLQQQFINDSLNLVHSARSLLNNDKKSLETKINVSKNVAKTISDLNMTTKLATKQLSKKFVDYTKDNLENCESFEVADEALNQAENVLLSMTGDPSKFSYSSLINSARSISAKQVGASIKLCATRVSIVKNDLEGTTASVKGLFNEYSNMSEKMKQITSAAVLMSLNLKKEIEKVSRDLNIIIDQRTKELEIANETINKQQETLDNVQEQFRSSIAMLEQMALKTSSNEDESVIIKNQENEHKEAIFNLTNNYLKAQEEIRSRDKEIEELKLQILQIESMQMIQTARIETYRSGLQESGTENLVSDSNREEEEIKEKEEPENKDESASNKLSRPVLPELPINPIPDHHIEVEPNQIINEKHIDLYFVPPFIIFNNETQKKTKGFSLLPRNAILMASEPICTDIAPRNPTPPQSAVVPPVETMSIEGKHIQTPPRFEKIRVKYIQNFSATTSNIKPNARVIVPKSKPKNASKIANLTTATQTTALPSTPTSNTDSQNSPTQISRVLSFENLLPLSEDDKTGSLIGYVTRYVKELPPGASIEKPQKIPPKNKLATSSVLISEVPPEKLRVDSVSIPTQRSKMSLDSLTGSITPVNSNLKMRLAAKTKADWIDRFQKRIKHLEALLQDKNRAWQKERDKSHHAFQIAFKANTELEQAKRAQKKAILLNEATKKRLTQALELVAKGDEEIARLKKLLNEVNQITRVIQNKNRGKVNADTLAEAASSRKPFPYKKKSRFEDEAEQLLTVFRGVATGLTEMAQQEINSIRKWTPKRDQYIVNERDRLISVLQAMNFITSPETGRPKTTMHVKSVKPRRKKAIKSKEAEQQVEKREENENKRPKTSANKSVTFESALVTANAHNPRISKDLKKGVVGRPTSAAEIRKADRI
ncbi:hypothetical protein TRFO_38582 [Tritrichomonas foetus]|uniref:Uncharacterized protein n=1 Tax=Tritrichomonas foetus TaxID=1144522 RepID=A0A1J4J7Y8_9EUKA|nr:hypothetical protein TRFO_38582 [Tritrichomonas foetus]|eukprot:OHS95314.1 hypothetical protein TRFO_38582 [Tritrichomonas foetus]